MEEKFRCVKLLALDFDGVLTDGFVYMNQDGVEMVRCSRKDGLGIEMLKENGIEVIVISKEENPVVPARCRKLKIKCWQKVKTGAGKLDILKRYSLEHGISAKEICFIGDDINDIPCIEWTGVGVTVADGHVENKKVADYITKASGGNGAVREVCELILIFKRGNL